MSISSRSSPTACAGNVTCQLPSGAVVVDAESVTGLPLMSVRTSVTETPMPAVLFSVLPETVELNCVRCTCGSGSGSAVLLVPCTQPLSALDHISWVRYLWPLITWLYGDPLAA